MMVYHKGLLVPATIHYHGFAHSMGFHAALTHYMQIKHTMYKTPGIHTRNLNPSWVNEWKLKPRKICNKY